MILRAFSDGRFEFGPCDDQLQTLSCAVGKGGFVPAEDKREGDGASPIGAWPIRRGVWRSDRLDRPESALIFDPISADDGWCDAPEDPAYNRPVRLPYQARCETMMCVEGVYDIVVMLGHNDDPPVPGLGSAIFLHCARPGFTPTEGCIALAREDLLNVLKDVQPGDTLQICAP